MKRTSAIPAMWLAAVIAAGYVPAASAQGVGGVDDAFRAVDNFIDDLIEGTTDAANAGRRAGDEAADAATDAARTVPTRRLPGAFDEIGEGAADVARQGADAANPPPLRSVLGEVDGAPLAPRGSGVGEAPPMLTDDIFGGFVEQFDEGVEAAPRLATGGADAAGAADAVPGYTKPGAPAKFVDDGAGALPGYTKPGAPAKFVDDAPLAAPTYTAAPTRPAGAGDALATAPIYDDFSKIGKIKPAKPPIKKAAFVVKGVDEFIVAPRAAVKTVKRASKVKKALIGGTVAVASAAIVGGVGFVLYETVGPVREGIDTAIAKTGAGLDTAYDATNQGFAVAGEKLKAVLAPGDPATFVVQNNAGALVEVYKTTASGEELLYSLSQDQEKVTLNVAIGDKLSIYKGGSIWAAYDMTGDTDGIEVVVE